MTTLSLAGKVLAWSDPESPGWTINPSPVGPAAGSAKPAPEMFNPEEVFNPEMDDQGAVAQNMHIRKTPCVRKSHISSFRQGFRHPGPDPGRNPVFLSSQENLWTPVQKLCRGDEREFVTRTFTSK